MEPMSFEEVLEEQGVLCWRNVGVSMMPLLRQGKDLMVIQKRPPERLKKYDAVLFTRSGVRGRGAYVLHRILKVNPDGTYWIVGDNCISGETVPEDRVLGVLTSVVRNGKTVKATDLSYRLYVYLWCAPYRSRIFITRCLHLAKAAVGRLWRILTGKSNKY